MESRARHARTRVVRAGARGAGKWHARHVAADFVQRYRVGIADDYARRATQVLATQAAGRITDVDYASETSTMTTNQMLMQAGTAMLKQSNSMSQMVMSLMQ